MEHTQTDSRKPIIVRADLTDEEWAAIRKEAIDRKQTNSRYIGDLIRAGRACLPDREELQQ